MCLLDGRFRYWDINRYTNRSYKLFKTLSIGSYTNVSLMVSFNCPPSLGQVGENRNFYSCLTIGYYIIYCSRELQSSIMRMFSIPEIGQKFTVLSSIILFLFLSGVSLKKERMRQSTSLTSITHYALYILHIYLFQRIFIHIMYIFYLEKKKYLCTAYLIYPNIKGLRIPLYHTLIFYLIFCDMNNLQIC